MNDLYVTPRTEKIVLAAVAVPVATREFGSESRVSERTKCRRNSASSEQREEGEEESSSK